MAQGRAVQTSGQSGSQGMNARCKGAECKGQAGLSCPGAWDPLLLALKHASRLEPLGPLSDQVCSVLRLQHSSGGMGMRAGTGLGPETPHPPGLWLGWVGTGTLSSLAEGKGLGSSQKPARCFSVTQ